MQPVVPYDPPYPSRSAESAHAYPPAGRRDSVFDRVEHGLDEVAHAADDAEHLFQEVGKAARVGRHLVEEVDQAYGSASRPSLTERASSTTSLPAYGDSSTLERRRSTASTASRKTNDDWQKLFVDLEDTQNAIGELHDDVEGIAEQRTRLTGISYDQSASKRSAPTPSAARYGSALRQLQQQAAHIARAIDDFLEQYKAVVAFPTRVASLAKHDPHDHDDNKSHKLLQRINSDFAELLDFVESRAEQEKHEISEGWSDSRLQALIVEDHPTWYQSKILKELREARADAKWQTFAKVDPGSYTFRWMLEHPFMQIDRVAISTIDMAEHRIKNRKDEKTGSWALGGLLSKVLSAASSKRTGAEFHEVGKGNRRSARNAYSEGKGGLRDDMSDSGSDDDLEKQKKKLLKGSAWAVDVSKLPERVPTDDTSGYQETKAELLEDAIDESKTEHILTPLVVLFWVGIFVLYGYYLIARLIGLKDPLGHIDLGGTFGNDRWNDTRDGDPARDLLAKSTDVAEAAKASAASVYSMASVLHSAVGELTVRALAPTSTSVAR